MTGPSTPPSTYRFYGFAQACLDPVAGDLVLVRTKDRIGGAIRAIERLRGGAEYAWCNHAAIVLNSGPSAYVAQAEAKGVTVTPLAELGALDYAVVHFEMTREQRLAVVRFAEWSIGQGYGYLSIAADLFNATFSLELSLGWGDRMVCSTQACRALERAGLIPDRSPYAVTPADLAEYADVTVPAPVKVRIK